MQDFSLHATTGGMMLNFDCQLDRIWNHLGDTPLRMCKVFRERFIWSGETHLACGQHHPIGWSPWLNKRNKGKWTEHQPPALPLSASCLCAQCDQSPCAASSSHLLLTIVDPRGQIKSVLISVALSLCCLCHMMRRITETVVSLLAFCGVLQMGVCACVANQFIPLINGENKLLKIRSYDFFLKKKV